MRSIILFVPFVAVLCCTSVANAMSCWHPAPAEHIGQAELIFFGEVVEGGASKADEKIRVAKFKILKAYKGVDSPTIAIRYMNDMGGNTGWGFRLGTATLVFAHIDTSFTHTERAGTLNYCDMIPYHGRSRLHPAYWDALSKLN